MSVTDFIAPGETRDLTRDWHNELARLLRKNNVPGTFEIDASAQYVEVHYDSSTSAEDDDHPMTPGDVVIRDETDWRGIDPSNIRITYTLDGVGSLSATQVEGEGETVWTWGTGDTPARDWGAVVDGQELPTSVKIEATAEILTNLTTRPDVEERGHLDAYTNVVEGERAYVVADDQVYAYQNGSWLPAEDETWAPFGVDRLDIVVGRSFHPELISDLNLALVPEASVVNLSAEAKGTIRLHDLSRFPSGTADVERTLDVYWAEDDGTKITDDGISYTVAEGQELGDVTVTARTVGNLIVEATYDILEIGDTTENTSYTTYTRIRVNSPIARALPTLAPPSLPVATKVTPGNGLTEIDLGLDVTLHNITSSSGTDREVQEFIEPMQQASNMLSMRLADAPIETLTDARNEELTSGVAVDDATQLLTSISNDTPQSDLLTRKDAISLLSSARTILSTLESSTAQVVRTYTIDLAARGNFTDDELVAGVKPGQIIYADVEDETVQLRVLSVATGLKTIGLDEQDNPIRVISVTCEGLVPDRDAGAVYEGHTTGAADLIAVRAHYTYGDREGQGSDVHTEFESYYLFDPVSSRPHASETLPTAQPQTVRDGWYVKYDIAAIWNNQVYTMATGDEYVRAEEVPSDNIAAIIDDGSHDFDEDGVRERHSPLVYDIDFLGYRKDKAGATVEREPRVVTSRETAKTEFGSTNLEASIRFFGYHAWVPSDPVLAEGLDSGADERKIADAAQPMNGSYIARPPYNATLKIYGHLRSRGGTCNASVHQLVMNDQGPAPGSYMTEEVVGDAPTTNPPMTSGVFLIDTSDQNRAWVSVSTPTEQTWRALSASTQFFDNQAPHIVSYSASGTSQVATLSGDVVSVVLTQADYGNTITVDLEFADTSDITLLEVGGNATFASGPTITDTTTGKHLTLDWTAPSVSTDQVVNIPITAEDSEGNAKLYTLRFVVGAPPVPEGASLVDILADSESVTGSGTTRSYTVPATVSEEITFVFDFEALDADFPITGIQLLDAPSAASGHYSTSVPGTSASYTVNYDPSQARGTTDQLQIRATTNAGNVTATLNITNDAVPETPTTIVLDSIVGTENGDAMQGDTISSSGPSSDDIDIVFHVERSDGSIINDANLTTQLKLNSTLTSVQPSNDGTGSYSATFGADTGASDVVVEAGDARSSSDSEARFADASRRRTINVVDAQVAPNLSASGLSTFKVAEAGTAYVEATDDNLSDTIQTLTITTLPDGLSATQEYWDGDSWEPNSSNTPHERRRIVISGTPAPGTSGSGTITVEASDGTDTQSQDFTITIATPDDISPPTWDQSSNTTEYSSYDGEVADAVPSHDFTFSDASGIQAVTAGTSGLTTDFTVTGTGTGLAGNGTETVTIDFPAGGLAAGTYEVTFTATDIHNQSSSFTKTFNVKSAVGPSGGGGDGDGGGGNGSGSEQPPPSDSTYQDSKSNGVNTTILMQSGTTPVESVSIEAINGADPSLHFLNTSWQDNGDGTFGLTLTATSGSAEYGKQTVDLIACNATHCSPITVELEIVDDPVRDVSVATETVEEYISGLGTCDLDREYKRRHVYFTAPDGGTPTAYRIVYYDGSTQIRSSTITSAPETPGGQPISASGSPSYTVRASSPSDAASRFTYEDTADSFPEPAPTEVHVIALYGGYMESGQIKGDYYPAPPKIVTGSGRLVEVVDKSDCENTDQGIGTGSSSTW